METGQNTARKLAPQRGPFLNSKRETGESSGKGAFRMYRFDLLTPDSNEDQIRGEKGAATVK
jgi:hypothetical protein